MKNINVKKNIKGLALGLLLVSVFVLTNDRVSAYEPTFGQTQQDRANRFLTTSGNIINQSITTPFQLLELAPKSNNSILNISNDALQNSTTFLNSTGLRYSLRQYGTAIFDNIAVYGDAVVSQLFAGFQTIESDNNSDAAKLQVNGKIKIESLADSSATELRRLCTYDGGILDICGSDIDITRR